MMALRFAQVIQEKKMSGHDPKAISDNGPLAWLNNSKKGSRCSFKYCMGTMVFIRRGDDIRLECRANDKHFRPATETEAADFKKTEPNVSLAGILG